MNDKRESREFLLLACLDKDKLYNNSLSSGKSCLVVLGVAVSPWATETVLSPWLVADEDRVSHVLSHVVWWKLLLGIISDLALPDMNYKLLFLWVCYFSIQNQRDILKHFWGLKRVQRSKYVNQIGWGSYSLVGQYLMFSTSLATMHFHSALFLISLFFILLANLFPHHHGGLLSGHFPSPRYYLTTAQVHLLSLNFVTCLVKWNFCFWFCKITSFNASPELHHYECIHTTTFPAWIFS